MASMNVLSAAEIYEGDKFFTDSNVQRNRALAGCDIDKKLVNEPGVITGFGLDYTKVNTQYGEVCVPWQVTGSVNGWMSSIYDFIGIGVPVTVDAHRSLDSAYPWVCDNFSIHIGLNRPDQEKAYHFVYNTKKYNYPNSKIEWYQWCGSTNKEVGKFIGKGGWNLRKLLEDNKIDFTHIKFYDEPDGEKMLHVKVHACHKEKLAELLNCMLIL